MPGDNWPIASVGNMESFFEKSVRSRQENIYFWYEKTTIVDI